jgi:glycosyltransferase involved in cell wall biosynthesis
MGIAGKAERVRRAVDNARERRERIVWPHRSPDPPETPSVAVVTVSFNTARLLANLLFSLRRVLAQDALAHIVVVENGSTDGTVDVVRGLAERGLITLVTNDRRPYHGPGLNRGLAEIATRVAAGEWAVDYVWVLDSDALVLRADALAASLDVLRATDGALLGQVQFDQDDILPEGYAHVSANLIDPRRAWRHGIRPFAEHGSPGVFMQRSLRRAGERVIDFPYYEHEYLLHLGRGTLRRIAESGQDDHRYFGWAAGLPDSHSHFHGNPNGADRLAAFDRQFEAELPDLTSGALADALVRSERVVVA